MAKEKTLQERLADYKILTNAIKDGETSNGYGVESEDKYHANCEYKKFDDHLIVEWSGQILRIFDSGKENEAKAACHKYALDYLRREANVVENKIYLNICTKDLWDTFGPKSEYSQMTKFGNLSDEELDKLNWRRVKRGLGPVSAWKTKEELDEMEKMRAVSRVLGADLKKV